MGRRSNQGNTKLQCRLHHPIASHLHRFAASPTQHLHLLHRFALHILFGASELTEDLVGSHVKLTCKHDASDMLARVM